MKKTCVSHKAGDFVKIAGIDFVVLDPHLATCSDEEETLLVLAVETVGSSRFGDTNNYAESDLKKAVDNWLYELTETLTEQYGADNSLIKSRVIDLLTLDGHGKYGKLEVAAAPLTLDEARKYADLIPECDEWSWLATGWGGPEMFGSTRALHVNTNGYWNNRNCSNSYGVRPALVVSSSLFDSEEIDLSEVPDDVLIEEIRRRIEGESK